MRVINRVHGHTPNSRADTAPALRASFAQGTQAVFTVAYFTQGKPVKGSEKYTHLWKGAEWRFVSSRHLDLFRSNPEKYAPQYGGY